MPYFQDSLIDNPYLSLGEAQKLLTHNQFLKIESTHSLSLVINAALNKDNVEIIYYLLNKGLPVNHLMANSRQILTTAMDFNARQVFDFLLPLTDLRVKNGQGYTALFYSVKEEYPDYMIDIIKAGASIEEYADCDQPSMYYLISEKPADEAIYYYDLILSEYPDYLSNILNSRSEMEKTLDNILKKDGLFDFFLSQCQTLEKVEVMKKSIMDRLSKRYIYNSSLKNKYNTALTTVEELEQVILEKSILNQQVGLSAPVLPQANKVSQKI